MLYCFIGRSGVGKDTVCNMVLGDILAKGRTSTKITHVTTRPKREGEIDGEDYYFISKALYDKLLQNGELASPREYEVANGDIWRYATFKNDILNVVDHSYLTVASPKQFLDYFSIIPGNVIPIILVATKVDILKRMIDRIDSKDYDNQEVIDEVIRRFTSDKDYKKDYFLDPMLSNVSIYNGDLYECVDTISKAIMDFEAKSYTQNSKFILGDKNHSLTVRQLTDPETYKAFRDEG